MEIYIWQHISYQLVNNENESEIEDLFDSKAITHKINGKEFTKNSKFDTNKYYGKDHFSQYILSDYENIDFSNFRPLLNNIRDIIVNYKK